MRKYNSIHDSQPLQAQRKISKVALTPPRKTSQLHTYFDSLYQMEY